MEREEGGIIIQPTMSPIMCDVGNGQRENGVQSGKRVRLEWGLERFGGRSRERERAAR